LETQNQTSLEMVFSYAGIGIGRVSRSGRFLQVNAKLCELTGYKEPELLKLKFSDITHPDDVTLSQKWAQDLINQTQTSIVAEKRYVHKQGHVVWTKLSIVPVFDTQKNFVEFISIFEDMTERKHSEDLLRHQKEALEMMAKNLPLPEILARITLLVEEHAVGCRSCIFLVQNGQLVDGTAPTFPKSFTDAINGCEIGPDTGSCGASAFFQKRIIAVDVLTDPHFMNLHDLVKAHGIRSAWSTPVLNKDGKTIATFCMAWSTPKVPEQRDFELCDVATYLMGIAIEREETDKILREQQVRIMTSSKLAALGEMARGLAHEINNPLAIINVRADQLVLASDKNILTPKLSREISSSICQTTERISKIIRGLRAFARDGEQDPIREVSAQNVIDETLSFCRERFKSHAIDLRVEVDSKVRVRCRPIQLTQVLLNLLNNSHDAVENEIDKWVEVSISDQPDFVLISVMDSGPGIPEHLRDRIVEPFFTTKGVNKGTGLGLSISSSIVESHHGTLLLDSESKHTRFCVQLPKMKGAEIENSLGR
jgi:PAS domain S-box-containing protein